ncbi:MAG: PAS domain S-box protein [Spirochaetes bacterium]|nr:PAS domain S-box protein [Spirochaetota bacterium]
MGKKSARFGKVFPNGDDGTIIARYRSFFEGTSYCIYVHDFQGNFIDANRAALDLLGYSPEEIPEINFARLIDEAQISVATKVMGELLETGQMGGLHEYRLNRKDGIHVWVETEASLIYHENNPVAVQGVARDITPRKKAEEALALSEKFNRSLVESSPIGILYLDATGTITYENPAMMRMMGVPEGEKSPIIGLRITDIPPIADAGILPLMRLVTEGKTITGAEVHYRSLFDREVDMEVNAASLRSEGGAFEGAIVMATDITERKRAEEVILKAQKLESIGVLAGGIAHDFNNMLTGILGNISMAKLAAPRESEILERLSQAEKVCLQARDLTHQLLTFSRGGTPVKRVITITGTLREAAQFVLSGSSSRPEIHIDEGLWPVEADEGQIRQVLSNIIINADQSMPAGGTITIRASNIENRERRAATDGTFMDPGRYIEIAVSDEGVGIPEEHLARIFDPYFTTKQKGSGLGLSVSYSIVRRHGGHILVEPGPETGATFKIYLPVREQAITPAGEELPAGILAGSGRVLVMDDDETIRTIVRGLLDKLGFRADTAEDSEQTVRLYREARECGKPFDAVILDLTIAGGRGGKETAEDLLALDPRARLIVSSGYSNDPVLSRHREYGFLDVLSKPYRLEDLSHVLASVIRKEEQ